MATDQAGQMLGIGAFGRQAGNAEVDIAGDNPTGRIETLQERLGRCDFVLGVDRLLAEGDADPRRMRRSCRWFLQSDRRCT